uniref:Uncharacterized protein n=1 Tax=Amphimedon queenslandica TaxID=400682 RepID=A0A1X7U7L5_AMPQE
RKTREVPHNVEDTIRVISHCKGKVTEVEEDPASFSIRTDFVYPLLKELAHVIDSEFCAPLNVFICEIKLKECVYEAPLFILPETNWD